MFLTNPLGIGIRDLLEENTGHHAPQYIAFVGSISIFVLLSNLLGAFPFFASPTGNVSVPLACAILTFLYFNWQGIRHHGIGGELSPLPPPVLVVLPPLFPPHIITPPPRPTPPPLSPLTP